MPLTKLQKQQIFKILEPFQPEKVWIFGSFARNENKPGSDLDLMVKFNKKIGLFELIGLEQDLTEVLGIKVDIVTEGSLDPIVKPFVDMDIKPLQVNEE